jgi:hypothetical protein
MREDISQWLIDENIKLTQSNYDEVYDAMWISDSVTGNASGSYTFNTWQAEENLCHNYDLLDEALNEFGCSNENILEKGAEWCDVTIRCYLLGQMVSEFIEEETDEDLVRNILWEYNGLLAIGDLEFEYKGALITHVVINDDLSLSYWSGNPCEEEDKHAAEILISEELKQEINDMILKYY